MPMMCMMHWSHGSPPEAAWLGSEVVKKTVCIGWVLCSCRVLDLLIDARAVQQNQASQLAQRVSQVQQLASDRDLAMQKLCSSEEKLVALESQLSELQQQVEHKQEQLAAGIAALDVAACANGPLAGLTADQMKQLQAMLADASQIVSQQRGKVQEALDRWKRSSGGGDATANTMGATEVSAGGSSSQLAWLQQEQRQLMKELSSLSHSSASSSHASMAKGADASQQQALMLSDGGSSILQGLLPADAGAALQQMPAEVMAYVTSLAQRMTAMQTLTEHISAEVLRKHEEALALQASFMQVEIAKQLLEKQLQEKSVESAGLLQQLQLLKGIKLSNSSSTSPRPSTSIVGIDRPRAASGFAPDITADGVTTALDLELQPGNPGYVLGVAQHFDPDVRRSLSLAPATSARDSIDDAVAAATAAIQGTAAVAVSKTSKMLPPPLVLPETGDGIAAAVLMHAAGVDSAEELFKKLSAASSPRSGALSAFGRSPSIKGSPAASPRVSMVAKSDAGHPWVPASVATTPKGSGAAVPSPRSPASPVLASASQAAPVSNKSSGIAGGVKKLINQPVMGFGSSAATKRSIPTLAASSAGVSGTSKIPAAAAGPSRIPAAAGTSSGDATPSKASSSASSPIMSPRPAAAVDRSGPVFKSSRAVGNPAATRAAGSSTAASKAGSLSASTASVGSIVGTDGLGRRLVRMLSGGGSKGGSEGSKGAAGSSNAGKLKSAGAKK